MSGCLSLPLAEVLAGLLQAGLEVPALVESLEDVDEVLLVEVVEVRDDGIEFVDHVQLCVVAQRAALDADALGPLGESVIRAREAASEFDGALPSSIRSAGPWD